MSTPFPQITRWNAIRLGHLPGMRRAVPHPNQPVPSAVSQFSRARNPYRSPLTDRPRVHLERAA